MKLRLLLVVIMMTLSSVAFASFDWGSDCSDGQGQFEQEIAERASVVVGEIPKNKANVVIDLTSEEDVDVQLFDKETGKAIIGWPDGLLSGPAAEVTTFEGLEYEYSGYNGVDGKLGQEYIRILGVTNRELVLKAYGYVAGAAVVEYGFEAVNTCNEKGSGSFSQEMPRYEVSEIGLIPRGKVNVDITLTSKRDLDIQLFAGDEAIVKWPDGIMNGADKEEIEYKGMTIQWSGYNGMNGLPGHEYVRIWGKVTTDITMKAFAYEAGTANVSYEWGLGAGDYCGTRGTGECKDGWYCKEGETGDIAVDKPGQCHGEMWCESQLTAAKDCANVMHIAVPGKWTCQEFSCHWDTTPTCPLLMPPHPSGCPTGWQAVKDDKGCVVKFVCPLKECFKDEDCGLPGEFCRKDPGDCDGMGTCWLPPTLSCPPPDFSVDYGKLCTCAGKTITDYCHPENNHNIAYKGECKPKGAAEGEMCGGIAGILCQDGLVCHITEQYPDAAGVCRDYSVNQGDECNTDADCEEGLLCSNFNINDPIVGTQWVPAAFCEPYWMLGEFSNPQVITIGAGSSEEATINVHGLSSVAMNAFVTIEIDMGYNGAREDDLTFDVVPGETGYDTSFRIPMIDPSKIEREDSVIIIKDLPVNFPGDDMVNGIWKLRVTNANVEGKSARLRSFGLKVSSRWD